MQERASGAGWTRCGTVQIDMLLAKNVRHGPIPTRTGRKSTARYIIHRVVDRLLRTLYRLALLIEKYGGAFPTWLAPVQVKILTITNRSDDAAKELHQMLLAGSEASGSELDLRNEKIGFKIREAQMQKIPYMFVLGDREAENKTVTIRNRKGDNLGTVCPSQTPSP